jgi:hypothetical protein
MFFGGVRIFTWDLGAAGLLTASPYDLAVAGIAVILLVFFLYSTIQEAVRLGKGNR